MSNTHWTLPEGVEEILPPQAWALEALRRRILNLYQAAGYDLVFTPLIEYRETLLAGAGEDIAQQTFSFTDPLTGRLLGIRADMTPQMARIDAHRLKQNTPTRLCYCGSVLRAQPQELGASRALIQTGVELFGDEDLASDLEVISVMLATLKIANRTDLCLGLGHVGILEGLFQAFSLTENQQQTLLDIYERKAIPELMIFVNDEIQDTTLKNCLLALPHLQGDINVLKTARQQLSTAPASVLAAIDYLQQVVDVLQQDHPDVTLYVDLSEFRGYHYHTGVVFAAYQPGVGRAIAQGGRYDHLSDATSARRATGFSTDLMQLI